MRILIAGSSGGLCNSIREFLECQGHDPTRIMSLALTDAVDRLVPFCPHVVILALSPEPQAGLTVLREILDIVQTRTIVVGPAGDPQLILRALREGAYGYIDETDFHDELARTLGRVRAEPPVHMEHGRVITVTGAGGGTGTSTVAVNVAAALAASQQKCMLVDLNLDTGNLPALLNLEPNYTIADYCRNVERMDEVMFGQCYVTHPSGIHLMASPSYSDAAAVDPRGIRKALVMARCRFPYVVVDLGCTSRPGFDQALYQSELILLVFRLDFPSMRKVCERMQYFEEHGIAKDRLRLIANRYGQPKELKLADVKKSLGIDVNHVIRNDPRNVNQAANKGVPMVLERSSGRAAQNLLEIAHSVNGAHAPSV